MQFCSNVLIVSSACALALAYKRLHHMAKPTLLSEYFVDRADPSSSVATCLLPQFIQISRDQLAIAMTGSRGSRLWRCLLSLELYNSKVLLFI
jgi:hypothetical protein